MNIRTDQRVTVAPKALQATPAPLPVSVRSLDVVTRNDRPTNSITPINQLRPDEPPIVDVVDSIDNPKPSDYMKLPSLRDVGRIVTKIGTVVPNPISTAVNVVNKTAEAARPQPPKAPGVSLPPPPVNLNPTPATPRLVDPNAKPKGWFMTTYENTFNNGITGKQIVWGLGVVAGILILTKTNVGRKVKRMFGGR